MGPKGQYFLAITRVEGMAAGLLTIVELKNLTLPSAHALFAELPGRATEVSVEYLADRRDNRRYEIRLPLHYRVSQKGAMPRTGSGTTCDLSTSGLSFRCRRALPVGTHIEMTVDWPPRYGDIYPIDLVMTGFIVRSTGGKTGVRVASRKFRVNSAAAVTYQATA